MKDPWNDRTPDTDTGQERGSGSEPTLTAIEAAARLGVNERTIRRAIDRGELAAIKEGGAFRISLADLRRFGSGRAENESMTSRPDGVSDQRESDGGSAPRLMLVGADLLTLPPLPAPLDNLIGRDDEVALLREVLLRPAVRLVTITGPGGVGKTRLAIATATALEQAFADGAAFVPLATVTHPDLVLPAIARALGLREAGDRAVEDGLGSALRHRQMLLVVDNFEQVVDGAPALAALIAMCPGLTLLTTSREPCALPGSTGFPLPRCPLPSSPRQAR